MMGRTIILILFTFDFVLSIAQGFAYPTKENANNNEPLSLPLRLFGYSQTEMSPQSSIQAHKPGNCYYFHKSQSMSSMLSDATKMLPSVHSKRERDWTLTLIHRIKFLAEHLRSHPESQNYEECMSAEDEEQMKKIPQPELYFVDDMLPNQNQKRSISDSESSKTTGDQITDVLSTAKSPNDLDNQVTRPSSQDQSVSSEPSRPKDSEGHNSIAESTSETVTLKKDTLQSSPTAQELSSNFASTAAVSTNSDFPQKAEDSVADENDWMTGMTGRDDSVVFISSTSPDCDSEKKCNEEIDKYESEKKKGKKEKDELEKELHARRLQYAEEERRHHQLLKKRIRKALLEQLAPEIKKLRTVGGTAEDLMELWKQSEIAVAKEEERRRRENDFDYEEDGAAAGDLNSNDKSQANYRTIAPSSDQVENYKTPSDELPYVHNEVLVQQLYEAARKDEPLYRSTRALDPEDEYLIISTHIPY